ncbi:phosphogluconate dehydratase [Pseudovibrio sp. Tun.PSC04-5.I4]|uniref:phosphogluconate dehydratase n=1 Tax=Pseudovibrio sp. Tun.PSC04-5.I4 TaxID=1798213 RepID=UPI0008860450|nr:phosphogluconate dehydratase [Pseudovibrio sp. Tun.PSC04-5.I4]SDR16575.1 6-phosphogluconate dehydratase [Pseudovibrio sp. Tun.PSC04-5.I4]
MTVQDAIKRVTDRIRERSAKTRAAYNTKTDRAIAQGPSRTHLTCGNLSHAFAASCPKDKVKLALGATPNLGIITAYNDMVSAHQPYERYPDLIRDVARSMNATAQVAGGVPAMCDGVTQGQDGMDISLLSRDLIAMSASVGLSHNVFDSSVYLGVCDKIVPGLVTAAATFGHLPAVFVPAGPMPSGLGNSEKASIRQEYAKGKVDREDLLKAEMASYHSSGTCTFYGTANSNQMLMEFMGLQLPGSSFINPASGMRDAITKAAAKRALEITMMGDNFTPFAHILNEQAIVNGIIGLNATGGSTNLLIHLIAMAKSAGIIITWDDFADISEVTPLLARVYPNGMADVNHFHAAGGLKVVIGELLRGGWLHSDVKTVAGDGIELYTQEPQLMNDDIRWVSGADQEIDDKLIRRFENPFQEKGGLKRLAGNLGTAVMKVSAVVPERHVIEAPICVFHNQGDVKNSFQNGELNKDVIVVVRYQGPKANGMPELHNLTPILAVLQERGFKVALVTDGRMSGASGKVPAAIHVSPEALDGGPISKLKNGDVVRVDAAKGELEILDPNVLTRETTKPDLSSNYVGTGRELFTALREAVGTAETGATTF